MIRCLMIPQLVTQEVSAESDVYSHKCVIRALCHLEPTFAYWWLRQGDERRMAEKPGEFQLFDELPAGFYVQMAMVNLGKLVDLFSWQRGVYPIDAVFCSRAGVAPLISLALADMGGQYPVPVILTEPRVYGPGEPGHNLAHPTQLALRAAGYASCFGMYWSKWEKTSAIEAAAQYCAPAVLKEIESRAFVVDALVDVDPAIAQAPRPAKPKRLLFAGRLNSNKRYQDVLDAYGKVLMARPGGEVEVWVHAGTGAFGKLEAQFHRWHRTSERLEHGDYHELIAGAHVGCYLSRDEGANVTTQEMIASGIVMALPDRTWVRKLFHPHEYPYLIKSDKELPGLLDWLLDHYDEAWQALAPIRAMIAEERSFPAFVTKFQHVLEAVKAMPRPPAYKLFAQIVAALQESRPAGHDGVAFPSAMKVFPNWQKGAPEYAQIRGTRACYEAVKELDTMQQAEPYLVAP